MSINDFSDDNCSKQTSEESRNCPQTSIVVNSTTLTNETDNSLNKIERLNEIKAQFDETLTGFCRHLTSIINEIESLRKLNNQLYRANLAQIKFTQNQKSNCCFQVESEPATTTTACNNNKVRRLLKRQSTISYSSSTSTMTSFENNCDSPKKTNFNGCTIDQLSVDDIDCLPIPQLNYFIDLIFHNAVPNDEFGDESLNKGGNKKESSFLKKFEKLCEFECLNQFDILAETEDDASVKEQQQKIDQPFDDSYCESSNFQENVHNEYKESEVFYDENLDAKDDDDLSLIGEQINDDDKMSEKDNENISENIEYEQDLLASDNKSCQTSDDYVSACDEEDEDIPDHDNHSLSAEVDVFLPEQPIKMLGLKKLTTSPTNSSSAVSSASSSPSSNNLYHEIDVNEDDENNLLTHDSTNNDSIDSKNAITNCKNNLKKHSHSYSSSASLSSSTLSSTENLITPPSSSLTNETDLTEDDGEDESNDKIEGSENESAEQKSSIKPKQKMVKIKSYDETGKETYENVVLKPVRRSETFASSNSSSSYNNLVRFRTENCNKESSSTNSDEKDDDDDEAPRENDSFANRRNMWERRSLGRDYKYRP